MPKSKAKPQPRTSKAKPSAALPSAAPPSSKLEVPLSDSSSDEGSGTDEPAFKVNTTFAKGFEARERAKELAYLEAKGLDGDSDGTSSSESEPEDDLINEELDYQLAKTIESIRKKDPKIYDQSAQWFSEDAVAKGRKGPAAKTATHQKKKYKDVVREQILEDERTLGHAAPDLDGEAEDERAHRVMG